MQLSFTGRAGRVRGRGEDGWPSTPGDEELRDSGGEERLPEQHGGATADTKKKETGSKIRKACGHQDSTTGSSEKRRTDNSNLRQAGCTFWQWWPWTGEDE